MLGKPLENSLGNVPCLMQFEVHAVSDAWRLDRHSVQTFSCTECPCLTPTSLATEPH